MVWPRAAVLLNAAATAVDFQPWHQHLRPPCAKDCLHVLPTHLRRAMNKEAQKKGEKPPAPEQQEVLPPRLEPMPVPSRRVSHLEPMDKVG